MHLHPAGLGFDRQQFKPWFPVEIRQGHAARLRQFTPQLGAQAAIRPLQSHAERPLRITGIEVREIVPPVAIEVGDLGESQVFGRVHQADRTRQLAPFQLMDHIRVVLTQDHQVGPLVVIQVARSQHPLGRLHIGQPHPPPVGEISPRALQGDDQLVGDGEPGQILLAIVIEIARRQGGDLAIERDLPLLESAITREGVDPAGLGLRRGSHRLGGPLLQQIESTVAVVDQHQVVQGVGGEFPRQQIPRSQLQLVDLEGRKAVELGQRGGGGLFGTGRGGAGRQRGHSPGSQQAQDSGQQPPPDLSQRISHHACCPSISGSSAPDPGTVSFCHLSDLALALWQRSPGSHPGGRCFRAGWLEQARTAGLACRIPPGGTGLRPTRRRHASCSQRRGQFSPIAKGVTSDRFPHAVEACSGAVVGYHEHWRARWVFLWSPPPPWQPRSSGPSNPAQTAGQIVAGTAVRPVLVPAVTDCSSCSVPHVLFLNSSPIANRLMSPLQPAEREAALQLIEWSLREDLAGQVDVTSTVLIPEREWARVDVVVRAAGVLAGGVLLPLVMNRFDPRIEVAVLVADGSPVRPGTRVAELRGPLRSLLTAERTALNFLLHLSGVASLTARYVAEVQGTRARVFDTRKTLPGWRLLDKYAVRAGGGRNHRMGLFDMLLVKDNHVAGWLAADPNHTLAGVVSLCRQKAPGVPLEIEVDTLAQLAEVLPAQPDMVLLDNMSVAQLREGVALRDQLAPGVELEASGGVNLQTIGAIAQTGVERISVGALTHSAPALDLAFDWGGAERQPREQRTANR